MASGNKMNYETVRSAMASAGLEDPQVLLNCDFKNSEELLAMLFPNGQELAEGVHGQVQALLDRAGVDAKLRAMATRLDVTGGLEDALHAAKKYKLVREAEDMADKPAAIRYLPRGRKLSGKPGEEREALDSTSGLPRPRGGARSA
jgi:hypothetical protein